MKQIQLRSVILDSEECLKDGKDKERDETSFEEALKKAQRLGGELLWLTTRTRPDLCYSVQRMGNLQNQDPWRALRIGKRILKYIRGTTTKGLFYKNRDEVEKQVRDKEDWWPQEVKDPKKTVVWTDSSFAPQGGKSQGALVVTSAMSPVFWKSSLQSMVTTSTAESELMEMMEGNLAAMSVGELINEVFQNKKGETKALICVDNQAAVRIIAQEGGSWRTRHLRVRSAAIKEKIEREELEVKHVAGKVQLGDLNTKTHPRARLEELDELWSMTQIQKEGKVKIKMMRIFEKLFRGACNKRNKTKKDEQSQTEDRGHEEEELRQVRELHLQEQDEQRRREEEQRRLDEEEDDQFSLISVGQCSNEEQSKRRRKKLEFERNAKSVDYKVWKVLSSI